MRVCHEHQCPMIVIDDLGYDLVVCLVDWVESLIGRAAIVDVLPGGMEGVQLIFSNGAAMPLLSCRAEYVIYVHDADEFLRCVSNAKVEHIACMKRAEAVSLVLTFRKADETLIVETHPMSAVWMGTPRVLPEERFSGYI